MRKVKMLFTLFLAVLLSGCMSTVDQMYCLPKRSEAAQRLQNVIDEAMGELAYSAPLSGENQQTVQTADLDGDGSNEYLVFAKGTSEKPLKILIFAHSGDQYVLLHTIESNGFAFDQVEYVQMDGEAGLELVVGRQVSDKVLRSVSVYRFSAGQIEQLLSTSYTKFLTVDLDADRLRELLILRPGQSETDNGVAELYGVDNGILGRTNEAPMSEPVGQLKRVISGKLQGGEPAVYVASLVGERAIITDVYAVTGGFLRNVSLSNDSGTSVQTLRNYYVYATDIDRDGVVELPNLINMTPMEEARSGERQYLIRWYAMHLDGREEDKLFTFHNYVGGWYFQLNPEWVSRVTVVQNGNSHDFYVWDSQFETPERILSIYALTGQYRDEQAAQEGRFVLHRGDSTVYAGVLYEAAGIYGINADSVINGFHLIQQEWKTGETDLR